MNFPARQFLGQTQGDVVATDFFVYSTTTTALGANGTATTSLAIEADSDFEVLKLSQSTIEDDTAAQTDSSRDIPLVNILIVDTGSGRQLSNVAHPIDVIFGSGQLPFILPNPKLFFARSTIQFTFTNLTSVVYDRITLSLIGRKIFRRGF